VSGVVPAFAASSLIKLDLLGSYPVLLTWDP
jgi:hypothetical protein